MKIVSHTVVHNEENFIWYSLMSVAPYVDQMLVWDTGSTDKTVEIIKEVQKKFKDKIFFKEVGVVDKHQFTKVRQQMLDESAGDWILVLDGDEVWWQSSIKKLVEAIKKSGKLLDSIAVPFYNAVGDIYHFQDESAGRYKILGRQGHLTIRAINKSIPGLHVTNPYGSEGYADADNVAIQDRNKGRAMILEAPYLHLTHLKRSSKDQRYNKYKYELGKVFSKAHPVPEVFQYPVPDVVPQGDNYRGVAFILVSTLLWPLQKIRRLL